jgi:hypothetical protein
VAHGRDFRLEFLAKLYFAAQEDAGVPLALIAARRLPALDRGAAGAGRPARAAARL